MIQWKIKNDIDDNDCIELDAKTRLEAAEEALKKLGYNLLYEGELENPKVIITVQGGCVGVGDMPKGIYVEVRDYDVEAYEEERIEKDSNGNNMVVAWYRT